MGAGGGMGGGGQGGKGKYWGNCNRLPIKNDFKKKNLKIKTLQNELYKFSNNIEIKQNYQ